MAIKNTELGGTDWLSGELLKAVDLNDTIDAAATAITTGIAGEAATRADEDGFTYLDLNTLTTTSTSETIVRTYTFNKMVDSIKLSTFFYNSNSSYTAEMTFYKGVTKIQSSNLIPLSGSVGGNGDLIIYNPIDGLFVNSGTSSNDKKGICILLNQSFAIGDTLVIKLKNGAGGTATSAYILLEGIKNKSADTTWVSVS